MTEHSQQPKWIREAAADIHVAIEQSREKKRNFWPNRLEIEEIIAEEFSKAHPVAPAKEKEAAPHCPRCGSSAKTYRGCISNRRGHFGIIHTPNMMDCIACDDRFHAEDSAPASAPESQEFVPDDSYASGGYWRAYVDIPCVVTCDYPITGYHTKRCHQNREAQGKGAKELSTKLGVHLQHCNFGEHEGTCKYGDDSDCPALSENWSWFGKVIQERDRLRAARLSTEGRTEEQERAEFEAHFKDNGVHESWFKRNDPPIQNSYVDHTMNQRWMGWLARSQSRTEAQNG